MILLNLPEELVRIIFLQWIELKEMGRLDSALCKDRSLRTLMLKYMCGNNIAYSLTPTFITELTTVNQIMDKFLVWCSRRNIITDTIMLTEKIERKTYENKVLDKIGHCARTLIICNLPEFNIRHESVYYKLVHYVVEKCPRIEKIHCELCLNSNESLKNSFEFRMGYFIRGCPNLQEISVPCLSILNLERLAYHCKRIRSITISSSTVLQWTAQEVQKSVSNWPELENWSVPVSVPIDFGSYCPQLRELLVSLECYPWDLVKNLAIGCPNLEHIDLSTRNESAVQLTKLLCRFSQLKYIYMCLN